MAVPAALTAATCSSANGQRLLVLRNHHTLSGA